MFDFRQNTQEHGCKLQRDRRKIVGLVFAIGLLLILVQILVSAPHLLRNRNFKEGAPKSGTAQDASQRPIDNLIEPGSRSDNPGDTLVSPMPIPADSAEQEQAGLPFFAGVQPRYLGTIRDDTTFRDDERDAWFNLLDIANRTDPKRLAQASLGPVTFAQLFRQPDAYRGRLVTVRGIVRRVELLKPAPRNEVGIDQYYRLCLFPNDNPSTPLLIYCLELPKGFQQSGETAQEVTLTGFFFKRWAYNSPSGLRTAPALLAKNFAWIRRPVIAPTEPPNARTLWLGIGATLLLSLLAAVFIGWKTRRRRPALRPAEKIRLEEP